MTTTFAVSTMVSPVELYTNSAKRMDESTVAQHAGDRVAAAIVPAQLAASTPQADQADLSTVSGLLAAALSTPDVRMDKVMALRAQIAAGTYYVSAADLAEKMLESMLG